MAFLSVLDPPQASLSLVLELFSFVFTFLVPLQGQVILHLPQMAL